MAENLPPSLIAALPPAPQAIVVRGLQAIEPLPATPGAYLLLMRLDAPCPLAGTKLAGELAPGWYLYAGSARGPGGIRARVARHFRPDKRPHWHIDRPGGAAALLAAAAYPQGNECELIARGLERADFRPGPEGFGSSDCRACASHLLAFAPA